MEAMEAFPIRWLHCDATVKGNADKYAVLDTHRQPSGPTYFNFLLFQAGSHGKPSIGPKESEKNVRNFSEEQMRAGQGVISLQYGSNKGATQSGINFGNTRHM